MLLKGFTKIETFFPPCHPGEAETVTATAELTNDISEVFPYLNAILKGTIYNPKDKTLSFRKDGKGITLYSKKILVAGCKNPQEAREYLEELKKLINKTYEERDRITPSYKTRAKLTVLDIYRLLPKTNCRECGEATCMAFATKLVAEETFIDKCRPFFTDEHKDKRGKILKILDEAGYKIPK